MYTSMPRRTTMALVLAVVTMAFLPSVASVPPLTATSSVACHAESDLDFVLCKPEHLGVPALKAICQRMGLDVELDVFPYLFTASSSGLTFNNNQYAAAAYECLTIEQDGSLYGDGEEILPPADVLYEHPEILSSIAAQVMKKSDLIVRLEEKLRSEKNEILVGGLSDGASLIDRPELVGEIIASLLDNDVL